MPNLLRDANRVPVVGGVSSSDSTATVPVFADPTTQRLYVNASISGGPGTYTSVTSGTKTSTSVGSAIVIGTSSIAISRVDVYAYSTNANTVAVGDYLTIAESTSGTKTGKGNQLLPGAMTPVFINNLNKLYLDVSSSGDGISYCYYS